MSLTVLDLLKKADSLEKAPRGEESSHCYICASVYLYACHRFVRACVKILADNELVDLAHLESAKYDDLKFAGGESAGTSRNVIAHLFGDAFGR